MDVTWEQSLHLIPGCSAVLLGKRKANKSSFHREYLSELGVLSPQTTTPTVSAGAHPSAPLHHK